MEKLMLCQDCLAVAAFNQEAHEGKILCPCGGEFCGCPDCEATALEIINADPMIIWDEYEPPKIFENHTADDFYNWPPKA